MALPGRLSRDAPERPPRFSSKRTRTEGTSGAAERRPLRGGMREAALRESARERVEPGFARERGPGRFETRRRHSSRRRIGHATRCPERSGRGEAPPRATADGDRRRRRFRSPPTPAPDPRATRLRSPARATARGDVPGGSARAKARANPRKIAPRVAAAVRRRRASLPATGFVPSAVVLAGRVGCRDRRAAYGRKRPGAMSSRKRSGLEGPAVDPRKSAENRTETAKSRDRK